MRALRSVARASSASRGLLAPALSHPTGSRVRLHTAPAAATATDEFRGLRLFPSAAHLARSKHVDLTGVVGSGKHGMITKGDVLAKMGVLPAGATGAVSAPRGAASRGAGDGGDARAVAAPAPVAAAALAPSAAPAATQTTSGAATWIPLGHAERPIPGAFTEKKPSTMRKVIASRLAESKALNPHTYAIMDCRIDGLLALRKKLKDVGVAVSVNDMVIKAAAVALRTVPEANASFDVASHSVRTNASVDISVAVATEGGLITPIIKDADHKGLQAINDAVKDLAGRARVGKLLPTEYQGGTFTISNLGMFGINEFTAVINPPQACILAVGKGEPVLVPSDRTGEPELATIMSVQLSADRRVVDEITAGQFLQAFREVCGRPELLSV